MRQHRASKHKVYVREHPSIRIAGVDLRSCIDGYAATRAVRAGCSIRRAGLLGGRGGCYCVAGRRLFSVRVPVLVGLHDRVGFRPFLQPVAGVIDYVLLERPPIEHGLSTVPAFWHPVHRVQVLLVSSGGVSLPQQITDKPVFQQPQYQELLKQGSLPLPLLPSLASELRQHCGFCKQRIARTGSVKEHIKRTHPSVWDAGLGCFESLCKDYKVSLAPRAIKRTATQSPAPSSHRSRSPQRGPALACRKSWWLRTLAQGTLRLKTPLILLRVEAAPASGQALWLVRCPAHQPTGLETTHASKPPCAAEPHTD